MQSFFNTISDHKITDNLKKYNAISFIPAKYSNLNNKG